MKKLLAIVLLSMFTIATLIILRQRTPKFAQILDPQISIKSEGMKDLEGQAVKDLFQDRWTVLAFGFTSCPDICPNTLSIFKKLLEMGQNRPDGIQYAFVTIDPQTDTTSKFKNYLGFFDLRIHGIYGSPEATEIFAKSFASTFGKDPKSNRLYHTLNYFIVSPDGKWAAYIKPESLNEETLMKEIQAVKTNLEWKGFL